MTMRKNSRGSESPGCLLNKEGNALENQQAYKEKLKAKIDEWDAKIREMRAKADQAQAESKIEYQQQLDRMESKRDELRGQLDQIKQASGEAWKDIAAGADRALDEMQESFEKAKAKFG